MEFGKYSRDSISHVLRKKSADSRVARADSRGEPLSRLFARLLVHKINNACFVLSETYACTEFDNLILFAGHRRHLAVQIVQSRLRW